MSRTLKAVVLCLLPIAAYAATKASGNPGRWQALVADLPAPPATLAQTAGMAGAVKDAHGDIVLGPTDPALVKSRSEYHAALGAMNATPAGAGMPGDAAAANLANRMEHASPDERMAMAMQYAVQARANVQPGAVSPQGMQAAGAVSTYLQSQRPRVTQTLRSASQEIEKLRSESAARHDAADAVLTKAYLHCPRPRTCGDTTDCSPYPACVAGVNARLPTLIARHRRIAQAELTAERAAYLRARDSLEPIFGHLAALLVAAEKAGAPRQYTYMGHGDLLNAASKLQALDAEIVVRAAFWQGIQPRPVAPDYLYQIPADYRFALGKSDLTRPPDQLPKGW